MATVTQLAEQAYKAMTQGTRTNGDSYWLFDDTQKPEWATDMAHAAHDNGGISPDDWRYQFMVDALAYISDMGDDADTDDMRDTWQTRDEFIDNPDALRWLNSRLTRIGYVDEYISNCGHGESVIDDIIGGYMGEQDEVFDAVLDFLAGLVNDAD